MDTMSVKACFLGAYKSHTPLLASKLPAYLFPLGAFPKDCRAGILLQRGTRHITQPYILASFGLSKSLQCLQYICQRRFDLGGFCETRALNTNAIVVL